MNEAMRKMYAGDKMVSEALRILGAEVKPDCMFCESGLPVVVTGSWPPTIPKQVFDGRVSSAAFFQQERAARSFDLHAHQQQAIDWLMARPDATIMLEGDMYYQDFKLNMDRDLPPNAFSIRHPHSRMILNARHREALLEDQYVAPKKQPKNWGSNPWIRSAMSGKSSMALLQSMFRATRPNIYNPTFDWENHSWEARRRLNVIKYVNVGTVGHIDWGNNRLLRTRPAFPGYLAECIRAAISSF